MTKTKSPAKIYDQDKPDSDLAISSRVPGTAVAPGTSRGTRRHGRLDVTFDPEGAGKRAAKQIALGTLALGALGYIAHELTDEEVNPYKVDTTAIVNMPAEDIAQKYEHIAVRNGDTLYGLANEYMKENGIEGDRHEIVSALSEQARLHDELAGREPDSLIQPGEQFLLPRR